MLLELIKFFIGFAVEKVIDLFATVIIAPVKTVAMSVPTLGATFAGALI